MTTTKEGTYQDIVQGNPGQLEGNRIGLKTLQHIVALGYKIEQGFDTEQRCLCGQMLKGDSPEGLAIDDPILVININAVINGIKAGQILAGQIVGARGDVGRKVDKRSATYIAIQKAVTILIQQELAIGNKLADLPVDIEPERRSALQAAGANTTRMLEFAHLASPKKWARKDRRQESPVKAGIGALKKAKRRFETTERFRALSPAIDAILEQAAAMMWSENPAIKAQPST